MIADTTSLACYVLSCIVFSTADPAGIVRYPGSRTLHLSMSIVNMGVIFTLVILSLVLRTWRPRFLFVLYRMSLRISLLDQRLSSFLALLHFRLFMILCIGTGIDRQLVGVFFLARLPTSLLRNLESPSTPLWQSTHLLSSPVVFRSSERQTAPGLASDRFFRTAE